MDSDRDLKDLIKEAADMEDAKYEEPFSLNFEDKNKVIITRLLIEIKKHRKDQSCLRTGKGSLGRLQLNRLSSQDHCSTLK